MMKIFELVNSLTKEKSSIPYKPDETVFVIVSIAIFKEFSKLILSSNSKLDKKNTLIKKDIKIKKDNFILSIFILCSDNNKFWLIILFGLTNLKISISEDFKRIKNRINFIPDVFETIEPPIIDKNKKNKVYLLSIVITDIPEVLKLLRTLMKICSKLNSFKIKYKDRPKNIIKDNKVKSS